MSLRPARDEHLADHRLDLLGALATARCCRSGTSRQPSSIWPFAGDRALDLLLAGHARRRLLRQEHHADAVLADGRQLEPLRAARLAQEHVGQLDQDARAVALQRIGARGAAMA